MSTLGNQTTGFSFTVSTWGDMAGGGYVVPSPGIIVQNINAYAGNNGTSQNARLYVWSNLSGKPNNWLVRGSSLFPLPGTVGWQQQTSLTNNAVAGVTSDLYLPAGWTIWIGIYCAGNTEAIQANSGSGGGTEIGNTSDGNWSDHGPAGLGQMAAYITYILLPAPTLTNVSPGVAPAGQTVTLTGTHLMQTTGITCCGVTVSSFTVNSDTQITMTVPAGAAGSGNIVVTTPAGTASIAFIAGGVLWVNTGTPASPTWTSGQAFTNTGTPSAPVWTLGEADVNTGTPASPVWTPGG